MAVLANEKRSSSTGEQRNECNLSSLSDLTCRLSSVYAGEVSSVVLALWQASGIITQKSPNFFNPWFHLHICYKSDWNCDLKVLL